MSNSNSSASASSSGIGFCGLLTIVFIVLKLIGKIAWPWIWVLAPLWISFAIWLIVVVVAFLILLIKGLL